MTDLMALAEHVATRTVERMREEGRQDLSELVKSLKDDWKADLGALRDDLTTQGLLAGIPLVKPVLVDKAQGRILVVDDQPEVLRAFGRGLSAAGMHVIEAADGAAAAAILEADLTIEVAVIDVVMRKNGYTLLEHVREKYPTIEVVMTSGMDLELSRARALGAFGFLPKPCSLDQTVLLVERAVECRRMKFAPTSRG